MPRYSYDNNKSRIRLGLMVNSMGFNQLSFHLVKEGEKILDRCRDVDIIAFFHNMGQPWRMIIPFPVMNIAEAYSFSGVAIATSYHTAEQALAMPGPIKKYFYVWDLSWMRNYGMAYEEQARVYSNPNLPLIARSNEHAAIIERCWNRNVDDVIEHCDLWKWIELVQGDAKR